MSVIRLQLLVFATCLLTAAIGCSPAMRSAAGAALGAAAAAPVAPTAKIMICGGEGHRTYLGCLSCSEYSTDSIFNAYGNHGSRYSNASIWNQYYDFGSRYSIYGACNPYATDPPVIVDQEGNFYGRLTMNGYHPQIGLGAQYRAWLANVVCQQ